MFRDTKQVNTTDTGLGSLGGELFNRLGGVLKLAGQAGDLDGGIDPLLDERRQYQLGGDDAGFGDHSAHHRSGA